MAQPGSGTSWGQVPSLPVGTLTDRGGGADDLLLPILPALILGGTGQPSQGRPPPLQQRRTSQHHEHHEHGHQGPRHHEPDGHGHVPLQPLEEPLGELDPRCLRCVNVPVTYESFDHAEDADDHENGQIWSATLWKMWTRFGRDVADRIVIESHFQLDGFTSFAKGARAILDADRHLFRGRHVAAMRRIFREQGIGPVE